MNVLFVCTGNICRSLMAEQLFKKLLKDADRKDVHVSSAGVAPAMDLDVPEEAKSVLKKEGVLDITHRPRGLSAELVKKSDLVLVMEQRHLDQVKEEYPDSVAKIHLLRSFAEVEGLVKGISDPYGQHEDVYNRTLEMIKEALLRIVKKI